MKLLVPGLLGVTALALAGLIAAQVIAPLPPVAADAAPAQVRLAPTIPPPAYMPPPEEQFADIDARPLFSANRARLAEAAPAAGAAGPASDFALVGVLSDGTRSIALLRVKSTSVTASAEVGGIVNGWRVARIDPTAVTLRANGGEFVVPLDGPANRPPSQPLQPGTPDQPARTPPAAPAPTPSIAPPQPGGDEARLLGSTTPPPKNYHPYINPEALRNAPIDPATGEPTL